MLKPPAKTASHHMEGFAGSDRNINWNQVHCARLQPLAPATQPGPVPCNCPGTHLGVQASCVYNHDPLCQFWQKAWGPVPKAVKAAA